MSTSRSSKCTPQEQAIVLVGCTAGTPCGDLSVGGSKQPESSVRDVQNRHHKSLAALTFGTLAHLCRLQGRTNRTAARISSHTLNTANGDARTQPAVA